MRKGATLLLAVAVGFWLCAGPGLALAGDDGTKKMTDGAKNLTEGGKEFAQTKAKEASSFLDSIPWYCTPAGLVLGFLIGFIAGKMGGKKKPAGGGGDKKK